jgi:hypothetical protein
MSETTAPAPSEVSDVSPSSSPSTLGDSLETPERDSTNGQRDTSANGADASSPEAKSTGREHKRLTPYERVKRQKAALQQREADLKSREEKIALAEHEKSKSEKPKYTVAELKEYREAWLNEGNIELVEKADKEIARLEALEKQEHQGEAFTQEWHQAESELFEADQEFMRPGTRLDTKLREIMGGPDGKIYRGHPRGIVAAYHRAKMEILESDHKTAQAELQQLRTENKRLNGLTSINSGALGRIGGGNRVESLSDFAKLSSADMLKHLKSSRSGSMPWL